ncbi:C2D1A protein, partial [Glaucidium brasilianum]|nr:C2D1A protein [Glaucidium brasilianum]
PLPMEAIEKMAALCMRDPDEEEEGDDDEELVDEDDLMAELQEVLGEGEGSAAVPAPPTKVPEPPPEQSSIESTLTERAGMYRAAIASARQAGDGSRLRRYERGLKTLESMLASVKKGKKIDEEEIPPPVALGKGTNPPQPSPEPPLPAARPSSPQPPPQPPPVLPKAQVLPVSSPESKPASSSPPPHPAKGLAPSPAPEVAGTPATPLPASAGPGSAEALLRGRQREYKLAALHAKQRQDLEMATKFYRVAKSFDALLEAVGKGQPVELSSVPPPPGKTRTADGEQPYPLFGGTKQPPRRFRSSQRMQQLPSCSFAGTNRSLHPPDQLPKEPVLPGQPQPAAMVPVPETKPASPAAGRSPKRQFLTLNCSLRKGMFKGNSDFASWGSFTKAKCWGLHWPQQPPAGLQGWGGPPGGMLSPPLPPSPAQQQLVFLEGRKKQLMQAALRAKQKNDIEGAKLFLRQAKGLDPLIEASQGGLPVDITKVPEAPVNKEDFMLVQRRGVHISPEAAGQYLELMKLIRQQHEMCVNYSKQFTHLGNIVETTKFEKLAEDCKQNMEILKQAHARGFPLPKYHYEQRTFSVIKIFPELNSNDMVLSIVKGINLPAPPGVAPNDLDAFVRFEFPYPNAEEAQKDKTNVIKNTDSPEFKEQFKLYMNRGHRGLRRVLQTKGIKFEVAHKGGLFKTDRVIGTAQLKLEALETICEVREILELLDGRRPTGGKLEVLVRIREPLSSQQLETRTERWLVINP